MAFECIDTYTKDYYNSSSPPKCVTDVDDVTERRYTDNKLLWKSLGIRGHLDPSFEEENPDCASNVENVEWLFEDNSRNE